jgi:type I restriction enzyme M protein
LNDWPRYVSFIWSVADLLRGDYKQAEYGRVVLPFVLLRRLDCVLAKTKPAVLAAFEKNKTAPEGTRELLLRRASDQAFYNTSELDFDRLLDDANNVLGNTQQYIAGFDASAQEVLDKFGFNEQLVRLNNAGLLYLVVAKFAEINLHPDVVSNTQMGYIFEELIRRFSEQSNEAAGEHFTPREVVRLKVELLFAPDDDALRQRGATRTLYDPAAGTGGMLSVAEDHLRDLNPGARLMSFGQELNEESYAICRSDLMLKGQDPTRIAVGNSLARDAFPGEAFDYMISNPPYGVEWKKIEREIRDEAEALGERGRFGAGLPRINDGSLLFLQHMLSKMKPADDGGSRISIVFNGSPLFSGAAGSGESEIRRWILKNDWLDTVVALPDQLFYNTSIFTYIWLVTNKKPPERKEKVQLIDARSFWRRVRKSLGEKRKELTGDHIAEIARLYGDFEQGPHSKVMHRDEFGYQRVTVDRPLRLRYEVTEAVLERVREAPSFMKLAAPPKSVADPTSAVAHGEERQAVLLDGLAKLVGEASQDRAVMAKKLDSVFGAVDTSLPKALRDAVWASVSVRDPSAEPVTDRKGRVQADPELRDYENVPLSMDIDAYMEKEVLPQVSDAWVDDSKTKVGYEIPLTRYFYEEQIPRPLEAVDADVKALEEDILELLRKVTTA